MSAAPIRFHYLCDPGSQTHPAGGTDAVRRDSTVVATPPVTTSQLPVQDIELALRHAEAARAPYAVEVVVEEDFTRETKQNPPPSPAAGSLSTAQAGTGLPEGSLDPDDVAGLARTPDAKGAWGWTASTRADAKHRFAAEDEDEDANGQDDAPARPYSRPAPAAHPAQRVSGMLSEERSWADTDPLSSLLAASGGGAGGAYGAYAASATASSGVLGGAMVGGGIAGTLAGLAVAAGVQLAVNRAAHASDCRKEQQALDSLPALSAAEMLEHVVTSVNRAPLRPAALEQAVHRLREVRTRNPELPGAALADALARLGGRAVNWRAENAQVQQMPMSSGVSIVLIGIDALMQDGLCTRRECLDAIVKLARQYERLPEGDRCDQPHWLPTKFVNAVNRARTAAAGGPALRPEEEAAAWVALLGTGFMASAQALDETLDAVAVVEHAPWPVPEGLEQAPPVLAALHACLSVMPKPLRRSVVRRAVERCLPAGPHTPQAIAAHLRHLGALAPALRSLTPLALAWLVDHVCDFSAGSASGEARAEALETIGTALAPTLCVMQASVLAQSIRSLVPEAALDGGGANQRIARIAGACGFATLAALLGYVGRDAAGQLQAMPPDDRTIAAFARLPSHEMPQHLPKLLALLGNPQQPERLARNLASLTDHLGRRTGTLVHLLPQGVMGPDQVIALMRALAAGAPEQAATLIPRLTQLPQERCTPAVVRTAWALLEKLPRFQEQAGDDEARREQRRVGYTQACIEAREFAMVRLTPLHPLLKDGAGNVPIAFDWMAGLQLPGSTAATRDQKAGSQPVSFGAGSGIASFGSPGPAGLQVAPAAAADDQG